MRNPWGKIDWKGDWSAQSNKWTPEIMKGLGYKPDRNDGVFWINIADFLRVFSSGAVCKIHEDYRYTSLKVNQTPYRAFSVINMKVKRDSHMFLAVS